MTGYRQAQAEHDAAEALSLRALVLVAIGGWAIVAGLVAIVWVLLG